MKISEKIFQLELKCKMAMLRVIYRHPGQSHVKYGTFLTQTTKHQLAHNNAFSSGLLLAGGLYIFNEQKYDINLLP